MLCCDGVATLAEQSAVAVLMSKLLDTAALVICAAALGESDGANESKSFFSAKKRKNTEHPNGYSVFLDNNCNFDTKSNAFRIKSQLIKLSEP